MIETRYSYAIPYLYDAGSGKRYPGLQVRISVPLGGNSAVDLNAHLDSGAEFSVFNGEILVPGLGLDLLLGKAIRCESALGVSIEARMHPILISHSVLGEFTLPVAVTTVNIRRNLLGRDFFNLIQAGFREWHETPFVTPLP
jgi:hypothetical protein